MFSNIFYISKLTSTLEFQWLLLSTKQSIKFVYIFVSNTRKLTPTQNMFEPNKQNIVSTRTLLQIICFNFAKNMYQSCFTWTVFDCGIRSRGCSYMRSTFKGEGSRPSWTNMNRGRKGSRVLNVFHHKLQKFHAFGLFSKNNSWNSWILGVHWWGTCTSLYKCGQ